MAPKISQQECVHVSKIHAQKNHMRVLGMRTGSYWACMRDNHKDFNSHECVHSIKEIDIKFIIDQKYL